MKKVIGVDLGTSSIKATLAYSSGEIITTESVNYNLYLSNENWAEQNPNDWYLGLIELLQKLNKKSLLTDVEGISFSGQMHGLVILDKNDVVIRNAILWNDGRTIEEVKELNTIEKLVDYTGNIALTGFTAPKILWLRKNEPENFKKIEKIMLPKDFLVYKITNIFASDVSDNSGTLYFDVKNKIWSKEMLRILEIEEKMLPKIFESDNVVGTISEDFSKITGLLSTTKVIIGGGDQAIGGIGTGTINNNQVVISLGTSGVVFASCDEYRFEKEHRLHSFCHANGKYHVMGVTLTAASSIKWWIESILQTNDYDNILNDIDVEKDNNIIFLPYLMGERSPINDPNAKSELFGLSLSNKQCDVTKAIIEGIAFSLYDCLNVMSSLDISISFARVIGGLTKSKKVLQIIADVLNIELRTINLSEGASLGAVIMAIKGCHQELKLEEICKKIIKDVDYFYPNSKRHLKYQKKFEKYKSLYLLQNKKI